jgi:hypothetical protein
MLRQHSRRLAEKATDEVKRMSQMDDRYEISCQGCGVLTYTKYKAAAFQAANFALLRHSECGTIAVYDRLAHIGKPNFWKSPDYLPEHK